MEYFLDGQTMNVFSVQRNLNDLVDSSLKVSMKVQQVINKSSADLLLQEDLSVSVKYLVPIVESPDENASGLLYTI